MRFALSGKYEITNVNPRKEAHGEDRILAVDVKLSGYCPKGQLVPLVGVESEKELEGTLWDGDYGDVTLPNVATVKPHKDVQIEDLIATIAGVRVTEATARKFSAEPCAGGAELTWTLSVPHPEGKTVGQLSERIGETVKVEAAPAQESLDLQGGEDSQEPDETEQTEQEAPASDPIP